MSDETDALPEGLTAHHMPADGNVNWLPNDHDPQRTSEGRGSLQGAMQEEEPKRR